VRHVMWPVGSEGKGGRSHSPVRELRNGAILRLRSATLRTNGVQRVCGPDRWGGSDRSASRSSCLRKQEVLFNSRKEGHPKDGHPAPLCS
jgi:hypothetical protein